jgi:predicted transcriptional regulator
MADEPKRRAGRPLTSAMREARKLIKKNPSWSAARIAAQCGLTRDAVQRDPVYKATRPKRERPSKVERAAALVDAGEASQREAAKLVGIHESAISKFSARQKLKQEKQDGDHA